MLEGVIKTRSLKDSNNHRTYKKIFIYNTKIIWKPNFWNNYHDNACNFREIN